MEKCKGCGAGCYAAELDDGSPNPLCNGEILVEEIQYGNEDWGYSHACHYHMDILQGMATGPVFPEEDGEK